MKLLYVIHYPYYGGPHNQALVLNNPLLSLGYDTFVVLPDEPGNAYHRLVSNGIQTEKIKLHRARASLNLLAHLKFLLTFIPETLKLRNIIRYYHIDLVIVGGLVNPHAVFAGKMANRPVIWQILDTGTPKLLRLLLFPFIKKFSDAIMITGKNVADAHPGINTLKRRLFYYVPPVDPKQFNPDSNRRFQARMKLGIDTCSICIGSVGNIIPTKGYHILLKAAAIIHEKYENVQFRILGRTIETHKKYIDHILNTAISYRFKIPSQVQILDPADNVPDLLPGFDIFVMSSKSEGIPTVVIEAMSCALPVIVTNVGAVGEIIEHGKTGYIVPESDPIAIAEYAMSLIHDRETRLQMGIAARQSVIENFGIAQCVKSHISAFRYALRSRRLE